ncbi:MAG: alpha-glucan family phosphorylase [Nanoarchaeota archaeon]
MKGQPEVIVLGMGARLERYLPTSSGGLEMLLGDLFSSAADLGVPMRGIILASNKGYSRQRIDSRGYQQDEPVLWVPERVLPRSPVQATIFHEGRPLRIACEDYTVRGQKGEVPVMLLDTNVDGNDPRQREITSVLYADDDQREIRAAQCNVLGRGALAMLRVRNIEPIVVHLNEGHGSFFPLAEYMEGASLDWIKGNTVFSTHTPVPAGHDIFSLDLMRRIFGALPQGIEDIGGKTSFSTTRAAIFFSRYVNAVSSTHAEACKKMEVFKDTEVHNIPNGIYPPTWVVQPLAQLYDAYLQGWRLDPRIFEHADRIPDEALLQARDKANRLLIGYINYTTNAQFYPDVATFAWGRRFATYKRPLLIFHDPDRLERIAETYGGMQFVLSGKSHPRDQDGKGLVREAWLKQKTSNNRRVVYLTGYDEEIARMMVSGSDFWLNTPIKPQEASGTSGMKVAANGGLNISIADGWWAEALQRFPGEPFGYTIGDLVQRSDAEEANSLYEQMEQALELRRHPHDLAAMQKRSLKLIAFYNTNRQIRQLAEEVYHFPLLS